VNLRVPAGLKLPHGIYACWVRIGYRTYPAALHYGPVPAFGEDEPSLEVHVLDHVLDRPPESVEVEVVRWIRPVLSFDSPEGLRAQIEQDLEVCRQALGLSADPTDRVVEQLRRAGVRSQLHRFARSTRTAREAAEALGTTPDRIVKSLVFLADGQPVLVLVSGAHRVSAEKLAAAAGARRVRPADPDTVARLTGFPAGAVPPVGHATPLPVFIDDALLGPGLVYAGAGAPDALVALSPRELQAATGARVAELREGS
jgi:Cys-tRNA(Pro) deacylase